MNTQYTKKDFQLNANETNNSGYLKFNNPRITHRFGGLINNNKIGIKTDSCNQDFENCYFLSKFNSVVKSINHSYKNYKNYYYTDNTILQFDTIDKANSWLSFIYDFIINNDFLNCGVFFNGKGLPKNIIIFENGKKFIFFKLIDNFTFIEYDFENEYIKNYKNSNDLYFYNFKTMELEPNLNCKTWIKN